MDPTPSGITSSGENTQHGEKGQTSKELPQEKTVVIVSSTSERDKTPPGDRIVLRSSGEKNQSTSIIEIKSSNGPSLRSSRDRTPPKVINRGSAPSNSNNNCNNNNSTEQTNGSENGLLSSSSNLQVSSSSNIPPESPVKSKDSSNLSDEFKSLVKSRSTSSPSITRSPSRRSPSLHTKNKSIRLTFNDFFEACENGDVNTVQAHCKLLDVNMLNDKGKTALHLASRAGHIEVVRILVKAGAKLDPKDDQQWTPLHAAAVGGHLDIVCHLLKNGHDPNARNTDRNSCLHYLARLKSSDKLKKAMDMILKKSPVDPKNRFDETPLGDAAAHGHAETCLYLLKKNAEIDARNKLGVTALQKAVILGKEEVVKILLEKGADPTLQAEGKYGNIYTLAQEKSKSSSNYVSILESLNVGIEIWRTKKTLGSKLDEVWRSKPPEIKLRTSVLTSLRDVPDDVLSIKIKEMREPLVSEFDGWVQESLSGTVPTDEFQIEADTKFYATHFYEKKHENYIGSCAIGNEVEPLIVSIATHEEINDHEFRAILWMVKGYTRLGIPKEYIEGGGGGGGGGGGQQQSNSSKKLVRYLKEMLSQKYEQKSNVQLDLVENTHEQKLKDKLLNLEIDDPQVPRRLSVGIVYVTDSQGTEQQYLSNRHEDTPDHYKQFLEILGRKTVLCGHKGYKADLDISSEKKSGKYAIYYHENGYEIMFHTSTMIPLTSQDDDEGQQLQRKRFIGNDVICIIYQDSGKFSSLIRSQFNHIYIVVRPIIFPDHPIHYQVTVLSRDYVPEFGPKICSPGVIVSGDKLRKFLHTKIINGHHAALRSQKLATILIYPPKTNNLLEIISEVKNPDKEYMSTVVVYTKSLRNSERQLTPNLSSSSGNNT
eukprot:TRINITY_DN1956_c0_g1_i3.p1 TRINITY_DN1956_c0_g1~~TRINITY_DN1956_c0_g1_i3.p1  ORF type:complete len:879 (-),score=249.77 TRINITY_DN1956_c0_g1_i3:300-2936(-)